MSGFRNTGIILIVLLCSCFLHAQRPVMPPKDTIPTYRDTLAPKKKNRTAPKVADNAMESKIIYGSIDSQWYDNSTNEMHLYGNAFVEYEEKKLNADYIVLNIEKSVAQAQGLPFRPSSKKASFFDGDKEYNYNRLKYNFNTEKGIVYDAISTEGEFVIHGNTTKYVGAKSNQFADNDAIYNARSIVTTCNHEYPHFGFKARKLKVVPETVAVAGPSNLQIEGIPTPVVFPFGFFPLASGNSSGFIFPQDYEFNSAQKGFGLRGFGWYFPFNDYFHLSLTADVYTRGSFALYARSNYRKKYKYNGSIDLTFDNTLTEELETARVISMKGFSIKVSHTQDAKAHPFVNIGGSINIIGNNNQQRIFNDARSVLDNRYTSNFYYRNSMPGTPFSFKFGMNHSQSTIDQKVNITFPDMVLNMNTIFPFKRKNKGSNEEKWYEKITLKYDMKMRSYVQTTDTTLFTQEMYDDVRSGMNQEVSTGFNSRLFKYFSFNANASYEENWVLNTQRRTNEITLDTMNEAFVNNIETMTIGGFEAYRNYNAGFSINTAIFGTQTFSKGWLRGIRHTMKPSIGYSYAPDTRSRYTDTLFLANGNTQTYTIFDNGPFNTPSFSNLTSQITYRLQNVLELKHWSKRDSTEKKIKLFDNLTISGSYNFAADSLKWSQVTVNNNSRFFKGITVLTTNFTFDPYMESGTKTINTTVHSARGKLLRLERGFIKLSNNITVKQLSDIFARKEVENEPDDREDETRASPSQRSLRPSPGDSGAENEDKKKKKMAFVELFEKIRINYELKYDFASSDNEVTSKFTTHSLSVNGSIPLTENWNISVGNIGYDFLRKGLSYPAIGFSRKLHCWDMNFSWFPTRDTYIFFIGVSSSNLSFIKYNYGQNNVDGLFRSVR